MAKRIMTEAMRCAAAGTHAPEWDACPTCGEWGVPTNAWECDDCGETCERFRGGSDVQCGCGAWYNASGQRLRDDWMGNPSTWDEDVSDLDGFEMQHAGDW